MATINRSQVEQFTTFLQRLAAQAVGERDLIGNILVMFGSGIGDGDRHNHYDLPVLLAGEGGGKATGLGPCGSATDADGEPLSAHPAGDGLARRTVR